MSTERDIYKKAAECRIFLNVHFFLTEKENERIWKRIEKYGKANQVGNASQVRRIKK